MSTPQRHHRDPYSRVVATLALVLALGTTGAYAGGKIRAGDIADDAVTSKAVRNGTLTAADLHDGAVSTGKVKDGSLRRRDLGPGALLEGSLGTLGVDSDPPATPSSCCFGPVGIELARPTRVLVQLTVDQTVTCPAGGGACNFRYGAYLVDGGARVPVPGTGGSVGAASGSTVHRESTTVGLLDLDRGTHELRLGLLRSGSTGGTTSLNRVQIVLLELGNAPGTPTGDPDGRSSRRQPVLVR